jgi:serine/threonine protein phosphatase PrpC
MATPDSMSDSLHSGDDTTIVIPPAATGPAKVWLEFAAQTHIGKVRPQNEDQYLIARLSKALVLLATSVPAEQRTEISDREGYLLLVADGMGGHAGGERASAFIVNEALHYLMETAKWFFQLDDPDDNVRLRLLREGLERADRKLIEAAKRDPALTGMGTTLTAVSLIGADAFLVHVGDSRAYLLRKGRLEQLTRDHTHVQKLVELGLLKPEQARTHRLRHHLTNALGGMPGVEGEIMKFRLADGDRLLLCSDGLTEPIRDDRIAEMLGQFPNPEDACRALIEAALNAGGPDNITVVVANCSIEEAR